MKIDTIITLKNGKKYLLVDETIIEDKKYFYAIGLKEDKSDINKEYKFIEEIKKDSKVYATEVKDEGIKQFLITVFAKNYMDYVETYTDNL